MVSLRGVDLCEKEASLATTMIAVDIAWHGESGLKDLRHVMRTIIKYLSAYLDSIITGCL